MRSLWWSRKRRSCSVAWTMKSERSRAASAASSPSRSLWPVSIVCLRSGSSPGGRASRRKLIGSWMVFEVGTHPLEQDHVVEIPAVGDIEPADEADPELLLVVLDLPREDRPHEELEERVAAAA